MTEITGNLQAAMKQYAEAFEAMEKDPAIVAATMNYDTYFAQMLEAQEACEKLRATYGSKLDELEAYIIAQVLEHGSSVSHAGVDAKHRSAYTRVTWNNKVMTELCMKNPALLDVLASARNTKEVDPSVKVNYQWPSKEPRLDEMKLG